MMTPVERSPYPKNLDDWTMGLDDVDLRLKGGKFINVPDEETKPEEVCCSRLFSCLDSSLDRLECAVESCFFRCIGFFTSDTIIRERNKQKND